jgi:indolepyruvate ferredoxin oxidoreductase beta subunit
MNILIAGVGGQGALLAAKIIGDTAMSKGFDVKMSEVHGMSKREGSVETFVRYSMEKIYAPIIGRGDADIVLGFEALEALRGTVYLKKGGKVLMNTQEIDPMPVITGAVKYPEGITERIAKQGINVLAMDAAAVALGVGNLKTVNVVMIGAMSSLPEFLCEFSYDDWVKTIRECVPAKFVDVNLKAYEAGRRLLG